jgi:ectoine hydroxylase-related dioxygenase (phytanoyl-CoA dioxygenase family)
MSDFGGIMPLTLAENISAATVEAYRRDGFVHIPNILTPEEVDRYHAATLAAAQRMTNLAANIPQVFNQTVNVWVEDSLVRELTLQPRVAAIAKKLAGVPLRLWHDHTLIKPARKSSPTEFHQDGPYWPHVNAGHSLSVWIALVDVPVDRGCMTFIPALHGRRDLRPQDLTNEHDLMDLEPELQWKPRVTLPLKAGDCTFHHSYTPHMANSNLSDVPRVAHIVIYMDADTTFNGQAHVVTDPLNLKVGQVLDQDLFPLL